MVKTLIKKLNNPFVTKSKIASAIGGLGESGIEAIPHLIKHILKAAAKTKDKKILTKKVINGPFANALLTIGPASLDYLMDNFTHKNEGQRYTIAEIIARFGENAVSKLIPLLKTGDNEIKANVAWTINSIGPSAKRAVPALNNCLAQALKPDAVFHRINKNTSRIEEIEIRKEEIKADQEYFDSLHSHTDLKPFELRDHKVIFACLAALGTIGHAASSAKSTVQYAIKIGQQDKMIKIAAENTFKKISSLNNS